MTRRWAPASIRTRLTLWYTTVLLLILVVVSGFAYSLLARALARDVDRSLLEVAESVRGALAAGHGLAGARDALVALDSKFHDQVFQVVGAGGTPAFRSRRLQGETVPLPRGASTFETVRLGHQRVRLLTLPLAGGDPAAAFVQVAVSATRTDRALARYTETLLGLAACGGALLARTALAPVDDLSRAARRIRAEDLGRRLELRGTGDELDRLAETLNEMLARLDGAFAGMRRFSADAAHELRTPLTALKGGLEVALRAPRSAGEYRRVLAASLEEVDRLIRLAEDLLTLARAGAEAPAPTPVDLKELAVEVLDVGARLAGPRGVHVRIEVGEPVQVLADRAALRRATLNLVENAVKYTPPGGQVRLQVGRRDGSGILSVEDTGPGIPPEAAARVFEPFVRLDGARDRERGGAGLGLSIARSIVAAHGGTLTLASAPGRGCCFTIRLPAAA